MIIIIITFIVITIIIIIIFIIIITDTIAITDIIIIICTCYQLWKRERIRRTTPWPARKDERATSTRRVRSTMDP